MNGLIDPALPWEIKAAIGLAGGLLLASALLMIPKRFLARISRVPCCSPNWITSWSVIVYVIGIPIYIWVDFYIGLWLLVIGGVLDVLDGKQAVAMKEHGVPRSLESQEIGEWWDPLADKLRQLSVIFLMMLYGVFNPVLVALVIGVDVFGTLVRRPFIIRKPFSLMRKHIRQSKASAVGKIKSLVQVFCIIAAAPYQQGWVKTGILPDAMLSLAFVLGVLSVISRVKISREVDQVVDEAHAFFRHQDI
jgi:phosphatidylglycerophosphate synthase